MILWNWSGRRTTISRSRTISREYRNNHRRGATSRAVRLLLILCVLIGVAAAVIVPSALKSLVSGTYTYDKEQIVPIGDPDAEPPKLRAKSAALYSLDLDELVYAKNEDKRLSPYSITKILTCYLALERLDPDEVVTASADATQVYEDGSTILLKTGEKMRVEDLIYGTLLASGNDAAYALGETVGGSEAGFAEIMNEQLREWGCKDTHFVNANGWKHDDHYTPARDMAIIAKNCFGSKTLCEMSVKKKHTIPATNLSGERQLKNYMKVVAGKSGGITAGKTGSWSEDDNSIVLAFRSEGLEAVIVLLGDTKKGRATDASDLRKFAAKVTPGFRVVGEGDEVAEVWVKHGAKTKLPVLATEAVTAYPAGKSTRGVDVRISVDRLEAPIAEGAEVGSYTVLVDGEEIGTHPLVAAEGIETGWFPSYIYISNKQAVKLGMICLALALLTLLVLILAARNRKRRARARREARIRRMIEEDERSSSHR